MTPEEFQRRKGFLGASEAAAACGLSPWTTPFELWQQKTSDLVSADSAPMEWGRRLESVVLAKYAESCDGELEYPCLPRVSPDYPWMSCTPDAMRPDRVVEIKTTSNTREWGEAGTDAVPIQYLLQVHHQMIVCGLKRADVPVLIAGHDFRVYSIDYDAELAAMLIERERTFWQHVIDGTPPDVKTVRDANARWQKDTGSTVEATQAVFDAVLKLRELDEQIAKLEADHDAVQLAVKTCMADASTLTDTAGMVLATWKAQSRSQFLFQEFKQAHPDLYAKFSEKQMTRVFRLAKGKL
jgi:putative phage-type endonuclease